MPVHGAVISCSCCTSWRGQLLICSLSSLQVFPKCGDGVNFVVTLSPVDGSEVQVLHEAEYEVAEKPTRQRLHFYLDKISTGDKMDLLVYPRAQHDCDGALILEVQIWEKKAYKG